MDISFEGIDELIAEMERIEQLSNRVKNKALVRGGDLLKERTQEEVYRHGLQKRTGEAQEAIVRSNPRNGSLYVGIAGGAKAPGFYLYMHEFGYYNVRAKRFIPPLPLWSIVFESSKNDILEAQADELRKALGM